MDKAGSFRVAGHEVNPDKGKINLRQITNKTISPYLKVKKSNKKPVWLLTGKKFSTDQIVFA